MKTVLFLVLAGCDSFPHPLKPVSPIADAPKFNPCNYPSNSARCVRQRLIENAKTAVITKDRISLKVKALQKLDWFLPAKVSFHIQVRNENSTPIRLPLSLILLQINQRAEHIKPAYFNLDDDFIVNSQSSGGFRVSFEIEPKFYEGKILHLDLQVVEQTNPGKTIGFRLAFMD